MYQRVLQTFEKPLREGSKYTTAVPIKQPSAFEELRVASGRGDATTALLLLLLSIISESHRRCMLSTQLNNSKVNKRGIRSVHQHIFIQLED